MSSAADRTTRHSRLFALYRQEQDVDMPEQRATPLPTVLSADDIIRMQTLATQSLHTPRVRPGFWKRLTG